VSIKPAAAQTRSSKVGSVHGSSFVGVIGNAAVVVRTTFGANHQDWHHLIIPAATSISRSHRSHLLDRICSDSLDIEGLRARNALMATYLGHVLDDVEDANAPDICEMVLGEGPATSALRPRPGSEHGLEDPFPEPCSPN